jgi:hypothetical protein
MRPTCMKNWGGGSNADVAATMSLAADDIGLPADPDIRAAIIGYLECGTRLAMENSQPGAGPVEQAPMPRSGWAEGGAGSSSGARAIDGLRLDSHKRRKDASRRGALMFADSGEGVPVTRSPLAR